MDSEHDGVKVSEKKVSVLLQGDERFFNRVISRDSSAGCSSRVFYYRSSSGGGVPFQWERQPGTPKHPPKDEMIPPLSPPPAVISQGLPKPCIVVEEPKPSFGSRFKVWKHIISKKIRAFTNDAQESSRPTNIRSSSNYVAAGGPDRSEGFESCTSSDGEFAGSPRNSSPSCSSSSLSFSNGRSRTSSSKQQSPALGEFPRGPYCCSPWNFPSILVRVTRRI